jgi:hypothetical protein
MGFQALMEPKETQVHLAFQVYQESLAVLDFLDQQESKEYLVRKATVVFLELQA